MGREADAESRAIQWSTMHDCAARKVDLSHSVAWRNGALDAANVNWIFGGRIGALVKSFTDDPIQRLTRPPNGSIPSWQTRN